MDAKHRSSDVPAVPVGCGTKADNMLDGGLTSKVSVNDGHLSQACTMGEPIGIIDISAIS